MVTYPPQGLGAPKDRTGTATGSNGLPAGTKVFSADDHISLADDIFYERFPDDMKDAAPRVIYDDGAWTLAVNGKGFLPREFSAVLMSYDPLEGSSHARHQGAHARAGVRRDPHRTRLPERAARPDGLARQGGARTVLPHLQPIRRRTAGGVWRALLRRRHHQLVGRGWRPSHAGRTEGPRPQDVLVAAQARQQRRRQADRLEQQGHVRLLGSGGGERHSRRPPHR